MLGKRKLPIEWEALASRGQWLRGYIQRIQGSSLPRTLEGVISKDTRQCESHSPSRTAFAAYTDVMNRRGLGKRYSR